MIAHLVQTGFGSFYDGVAHALVSIEDLLLIVGLGLLSGLRGRAVARGVVIALPLAWLVGAAAGALLGGPTSMAVATSLTFLGVGALVALDARLQRSVVVALAAAGGAFHGYLNGVALRELDGVALAISGVVLAVFTLVTFTGSFAACSTGPHWRRVAVRVAGSWMAAIGLLMVGWSIRGGA
ncbi:MAG: HupE/UreJ family protein [Planctomycetota bacterium]